LTHSPRANYTEFLLLVKPPPFFSDFLLTMQCFKTMSKALFIFATLLSCQPGVDAAGFLRERPNAAVSVQAINAEMNAALASVLGAGHGVEHTRLQEAQNALASTFKALPKNSHGRVDVPMLHYALHRYFSSRYSIQVKGLEPSRNTSSQKFDHGAMILLDQIPNYVEGVLEGRLGQKGFGLEETAAMAVTLEQLVLGSSTGPLGKAYGLKGLSTATVLNQQQLDSVLEVYVLQWLVGDATEINAAQLVENRPEIEESMPQWGEVTEFARGEAQRFLHERMQRVNPFSGASAEPVFKFEDVQGITRSITAGFGHWWEQECQGIKANLVALDTEEAGRVKLSKFYKRSMEGEWRFGESEAYLRELGALDDSSYWRGPQVLIPNYLLAASNCIVTSTFYRVCCINECEALQQRVEAAVEAPVGTLADVTKAVEEVWVAEGRGEKLEGGLQAKLKKIAETHRGKVPLHGRLFAQWMHYAFPQECPFPHRSGEVLARSPTEFGDKYQASKAEMRRHARQIDRKEHVPKDVSIEESWGMSQWLDDEELLTDYTELSPTSTYTSPTYLIMALMVMGLAILARGKFSLFSLLDMPSQSKTGDFFWYN